MTTCFLQEFSHEEQGTTATGICRHWDEKTASFKVNRKLNARFDYGLGQDENIIDFGVLYYNYTIAKLLKKLPGVLSFQQQQTLTVQQPSAKRTAAKRGTRTYDKIDSRKAAHKRFTLPLS